MSRGKLIVISGASGVGKGTVLARIVVNIKAELEKIREQTQNIE